MFKAFDEALLMNELGMRLVTGMGAEGKEDETFAIEELKAKLEERKSAGAVLMCLKIFRESI